MHKEYLDWINAHTLPILLCTFAARAALFQYLIVFRNTHISRIIILSGMFSLAFGFAGNDLMNFVGFPLAAYESYTSYIASNVSPDIFKMESLKNAVQTPTLYLLLSGLVMVLTLWFSKKAHRVVQTSINRSSTRGEQEQFDSSLLGRVVVR